MPSATASSPAAIRPSDFQTLATFRYTLSRFLCFSAAAARRVGLAPQQHQALLAIKGFPEREWVTVGELAERLQLRHHSAVGLVDRLARRGLVRRERAAKDRRNVHVRLTARGETLLARLSSAHREELRRIGPELRALLNRIGG